MKKTIILAFLIIISCQSKNKKKTNTIENTETIPVKDSLIITKITSNKIPNSITYKGKFKEGYIWKNGNENNIVFITETGEFENENGVNAELFSYCYNLNGNTAELNWKVYDFVIGCPVDIITRFTDKTFNITDLNENGIAEIWLMYETACTGDLSPNDMKVIMYEGKQKFAMRGQNTVKMGVYENGEPVIYGGDYKFDKNFNTSPKVFKDYAQKLWENNL